jgi:hypothetical protein
MEGCAKCNVQRDGQEVRIYYGNKKSESSQSFTSGKGTKTEITSVTTTTNYSVGGWDDVSICNHCTKKHSLIGGWFNAFWSVPLALIALGGIIATFFSKNLQQSFKGSPLTTIVGSILIIFLITFYITNTAVVSVRRIIKPLNDNSRSIIARKIMVKRHAGKYDTFWTQAELEKLKLG